MSRTNAVDIKSNHTSPQKGYYLEMMTNYRGISLMTIAAKVYNRVLLNRIRDTHHHHHTRDARKRFHSIKEASIGVLLQP